jgi:hypothetical protein
LPAQRSAMVSSQVFHTIGVFKAREEIEEDAHFTSRSKLNENPHVTISANTIFSELLTFPIKLE